MKQKQTPEQARLHELKTFRTAVIRDLKVATEMLRLKPYLLEARSGTGETALHYCAIEDQLDAIRWPIARGANVNTTDDTANTPLMHAAQLGYLGICSTLIAAGAKVQLKNQLFHDTALHLASQYGHAEICELLLTAGAEVNAENSDGERPWSVTLHRKRERIHTILQKHGGSPKESDSTEDQH